MSEFAPLLCSGLSLSEVFAVTEVQVIYRFSWKTRYEAQQSLDIEKNCLRQRAAVDIRVGN